MTRKLWILSLVAGLFVALPGAASAATTVGVTMTGTPTIKPGSCNVVTPGVPVSCTVMVTQLADANEIAPGGIVSQVSGVITRWRVNAGASTASSLTFTPRVVGTPSNYVALRSGTPRAIPPAGGVLTFEEHLPIGKGDYFAMDSIANGVAGDGPVVVASIGTAARFYSKTPALADGEAFSISIGIGTPPQTKLLLSADIEPDADGDTYGDETQDLCVARADVHTACPPPLLSKPTFAKGAFSFTSDIAGKANTTLFKITSGRRSGKKCKAKAKVGKKCTIYTKFAQWNDDVVPGANKIDCAYKVGGKSLKPGKYRATIVITSAQNTVATKTVDFSIKKAKKKK